MDHSKVDIADINYYASSSAHSFKVFKPAKRKSSRVDKIVPMLSGQETFNIYNKRLLEAYVENEELLFANLVIHLKDFVLKVESIYGADEPTSFRYLQCAIVSMSTNVNELTCLFDNLSRQIETVTSYRLVVNSDGVKCVTDFVKLIQQQVFRELIHEEINFPSNFYGLTADFFEQHSRSKLPIAVIIEDFDCFNAELLCDLIMLIHENLAKMPIFLICCQSTNILALNVRLPSKATNTLAVENFSFRPSKDFFYTTIHDICFSDDFSFKLGPKVISHLIDVYRLWDTSISGAYRRIRLCLFEHFFSKKYSKLCCPRSELTEAVDSLTDDELDLIKNLPSLKDQDLPKDHKLARSYLKEDLIYFLDQLEDAKNELLIYHQFKRLLFKGETSSFLEDTWLPFLSADKLSETPDFRDVNDKFHELEVSQIETIMDNLSQCRFNSSVIKSLNNHRKDLRNQTKGPDEPMKENKPVDPQQRTRASNGIWSPRKASTSRFDFTNSLKTNATKQINKLKKWKDDFTALLREALDKIVNPFHLPYHEIFFFDDIDSLKELTMPTTRNDILFSLESPHEILKCKCCKRFNKHSPDVSITYSIYRDNLRVANLRKCFDYFYGLINEPDNRVSPRKKLKKGPKYDEKTALLRFIISIGDLEYIGLVRAHPRKVDHIERLVWPVNEHSKGSNVSDDQISLALETISLR